MGFAITILITQDVCFGIVVVLFVVEVLLPARVYINRLSLGRSPPSPT